MKALFLATAVSAVFALPALAQNQTQTTPQTNQTQPMNQAAQPTTPSSQTQASAGTRTSIPPRSAASRSSRSSKPWTRYGFGAGRADGIWGPETQSALEKFQKAKNMGTANGQLDQMTLSALQLDPNQFPQANGGMANGGRRTAAMSNGAGGSSAATNSGMNNGANTATSKGASGGASMNGATGTKTP